MRFDGRVRSLQLTRRRQIFWAAGTLGLGAWIVVSAVALLSPGSVETAAEVNLERQRLAQLVALSAEKAELARTVNSFEERLAQAERDKEALAAARAADEARLAALSAENAGLTQTVDRIEDRLAQAERDKDTLATKTSALRAEIANLNRVIAETPADVAAVLERLEGLRSDLKLATGRAERAESQRGFYAARAASLGSRLDEIAASQNAVVRRLSDRALRGIDMIQQIVEKTGINVNDLLPEEDAASLGLGQGGPFIAAELFAGDIVAGDFLIENDPDMELQVSVAMLEQQMSRLEFLQKIIGSIPLTSPLDQYRVSSRYGQRKDPVNGRAAMHFGLDMAAPMRTPVMATRPGTVIFAGWKTGLGRVVELDHGSGIRTFYGHLRKILVEKDQEVAHRETIGLLGSSGRSTGPHVHYEILVNDTPYDPMKFLKAGRDALKG